MSSGGFRIQISKDIKSFSHVFFQVKKFFNLQRNNCWRWQSPPLLPASRPASRPSSLTSHPLCNAENYRGLAIGLSACFFSASITAIAVDIMNFRQLWWLVAITAVLWNYARDKNAIISPI